MFYYIPRFKKSVIFLWFDALRLLTTDSRGEPPRATPMKNWRSRGVTSPSLFARLGAERNLFHLGARRDGEQKANQSIPPRHQTGSDGILFVVVAPFRVRFIRKLKFAATEKGQNTLI